MLYYFMKSLKLLFQDKLTEDDCVENGYVIKGFPRTRADFEWLDSTEIAPNR